ncbi:MAG: hypothetical protein ACRDTD_29630 [Pseudonocardiaceae bacterium]
MTGLAYRSAFLTSKSIKHEELSTLQRLSSIDKHRIVHVTAWHPTDVYAGSNEGLKVGWRPNCPVRPDGDVIGWWVLEGTDEKVGDFWPKAEVGLSLQYHLDLNWPGIALDQFLEGLLRYVASVVVPMARMIGRALW